MLAASRSLLENDLWPIGNQELCTQNLIQKRMSETYDDSASALADWTAKFGRSKQNVAANRFPSHTTRGSVTSSTHHSEMDKSEKHSDIPVKDEDNSPTYTNAPHLTAEGKSTPGNPLQVHQRASDRKPAHIAESTSENIPTIHQGRFGTSVPVSCGSIEDWPARSTLYSLDDHDWPMKDEDDDEGEYDEDERIQTERPQTAAERSAARRKMKRFRLTHQQTRFLMTEFVKQPHPDAAHRERLSREIPGLSPRQVQVWFQNRRAKIKRLNAEDRDRVIQMRAVPDDFDSVQALHSPYGAVHGFSVPLASPVGPGGQLYPENIARQMLPNARSIDEVDKISPTSHTASLEGSGFPTSMVNSEILLPISQPPRGQYSAYQNHLSSGETTVGAAARYPGLQAKFEALPQLSQSSDRSLQAFSFRDAGSRPGSNAVSSLLRNSASGSWDDNTGYYLGFNFGEGLVTGIPEDQQIMYRIGTDSPTQSNSYELNKSSSRLSRAGSIPWKTTPNLSGRYTSTTSGRGGSTYSGMPEPNLTRLRPRASSATVPPNLDLRGQYLAGDRASYQKDQLSPNKSKGLSSEYGGPSIYTTSYPPAPLTAPINMSQNRRNLASKMPETPTTRTEHHLSAPNTSTGTFPESVRNSLSGSSLHTPMRDSFGGGRISMGTNQDHLDGYAGSLPSSNSVHKETG